MNNLNKIRLTDKAQNRKMDKLNVSHKIRINKPKQNKIQDSGFA